MIDLARIIELPLAPPEAWSALWDVPKLAGCVPGCGDVQEVEAGHRYRATVQQRIGPFNVEVPLEVVVDSLEAGVRLAVKATGRDKVLSSPVKVSLTVALAPGGGGTVLTLQGKAEVGGKLAGLGQGIIQRKTRDILDAFATNLDRLLKGREGGAVV